MSNFQYLAVEMWCGFEDIHPPHLWGDPQRFPGGPVLTIAPCPGKPFPVEEEGG